VEQAAKNVLGSTRDTISNACERMEDIERNFDFAILVQKYTLISA